MKQATKWNLGGTTKDMKNLDYSGSHGDCADTNGDLEEPTELEVRDTRDWQKYCSVWSVHVFLQSLLKRVSWNE